MLRSWLHSFILIHTSTPSAGFIRSTVSVHQLLYCIIDHLNWSTEPVQVTSEMTEEGIMQVWRVLHLRNLSSFLCSNYAILLEIYSLNSFSLSFSSSSLFCSGDWGQTLWLLTGHIFISSWKLYDCLIKCLPSSPILIKTLIQAVLLCFIFVLLSREASAQIKLN